ncbi:hypothetical protein QQ045_010963 [Rhodiola kirilowii]
MAVFQVRANFVKVVEKRAAMWERQHEVAADKIYNMCTDLGGFFFSRYISLNTLVAQIVEKPDLAPAWVRKLVTLRDHAPHTPFDTGLWRRLIVSTLVLQTVHTYLAI